MKILLTTDAFYPMINGVAISTINLYKQLKEMGHDVRILTLSSTKQERIDGDIYYLKAFKVKVYPDAKVKHLITGELEKSLIEWKPDIVHSQTEFSTLIAAKYIVKKSGAAHIHTYHTMYEEYVNYVLKGKLIKPKMVGKIVKVLFAKMEGIIVPTQKMKECLLSFKIDKPLYIVPTGLDLSKFQKKISEEERNYLISKYELQNSRVLVYVGRIGEEKNIDEIVDYFGYASEQIKDLKLLIVGGGPYLEKLKKLVDKSNITDKVIFTGMIPPEEIYKYYQLGQVFVTASKSETQGLTYIEAFACGTPVICRRDKCVDGLVLNGINGYMYDNKEEFVKYIKKFVLDDEYRRKASINAEEKAMEYSAKIFGQNVYRIYERTVIEHRNNKTVTQFEKVNNILNRLF